MVLHSGVNPPTRCGHDQRVKVRCNTEYVLLHFAAPLGNEGERLWFGGHLEQYGSVAHCQPVAAMASSRVFNIAMVQVGRIFTVRRVIFYRQYWAMLFFIGTRSK